MRIGIDIHAVEQDGSGNCTYMRGLVQGLARVDTGNEYVLYGTRLEHPFYETLRRLRRFEIRRLWPGVAPLRIPLTLAMRSALDRLDLLHVQYGGPPWLRGRLVSTIHDAAFAVVPETFSPSERLWMPRLIRLTARRATMVLTGSEFARRHVAGWAGIPIERVCVTYYGVGPEFAPVPAGPARDAVLARYGISSPFVLSLGRLNLRKNLLRVVEAFERLARPGLQLVIGGVADSHSDVLAKRLQDSPSRAAIRRVGFIAAADLPAVLSAAAVFVYPSLFEGFGLPPLEAAACGAPVIASNVTALPEVLGDGALLVDPTDTEAVATALERTLTDGELRAELRRRGLQRAAQFTWDAAAQRTLAAYSQAAASE
jgi:glycosyltransferase involved in cell wall biosynthesis